MARFGTTVMIGVFATLLMDLWGVARRPLLGWPRLDYRLLGRWVGWMPRGRLRHAPITAAPPLPGEFLIGWTAHYAIGIAFAGLLVGVAGTDWLEHPTPGPALLVGVATVLAPLFLMQPAMGAPRTARARFQSLITHTVYGLGLYAGAWIISFTH